MKLQLPTGAAVTATLTCANASGAATACTSGAVRSASLVPTKPLVPGQRYTFLVQGVTDPAGSAVSASQAFRASIDQQETSLAALYRWRIAKATKAYGRSYVVESRKGAWASWAFTGTAVTWYTMTAPTQGRATVYVDGVRKASVNNWSAATKWHVARTVKGLKAGRHTLKIVVNGTKGSTKGKGTQVVLDAAKVGTKLVAAPAVTIGWSRSTSSAASGGGYAATALAGASASLPFRGTAVTWVTATGPAMGKAKVYVDGVLKVTVDNYAKRAAGNVRRTVTGLSDAVHTVKVVVTGTKRKASKGTTVVVDRWLVR